MTTLQQLSTLRQWRQICYVTTLDVQDVEYLLQLIVDSVIQGTGAHACALMYDSPSSGTMRASAGSIDALVQELIVEVETSFVHGALTPTHRDFADITLATFPLTINGEHVGLLHLAAQGEINDEDLQVLVVMITNALARHQSAQHAAHTALHTQQQHLRAQQAITHILAESASFNDAAPIILQAFCESLGWDLGELWNVDPAAQVLRCTTFWHTARLPISELLHQTQVLALAPGEGVPGHVWQSGDGHWINDVVQHASAPSDMLAAKYHLRNAVGFPIRNEYGIQGVIVLRRQPIRPVDQRLIDLLTAFGSQIGQFIERKRIETENQRLAEALRLEQNRLLRREIEVRTQIGRDLHDGPVQQVAMAGMAAQYVRRVAERAPEMLAGALTDLEDQLKHATQDLRTVLYELRPLGITQDGLVSVLQQYIAKLRDPSGLDVYLDAPADMRRLSLEYESALFIIIQEAINNARKHAAAQHIRVTLRDDGTALCAMVEDDGHGYNVAQIQGNYVQRNSFGLLNMEERAQLSGGTCWFESTIGRGSTVHVRIPYVAADRLR